MERQPLASAVFLSCAQLSLQCPLLAGHSPTPTRKPEGEGAQGASLAGLENGCGLRVEEQTENNKPSQVMCFSLVSHVQFSMYDGIRSFKKAEG